MHRLRKPINILLTVIQVIRIQSTKNSKSPLKLWGRLSPGHVLTSFKRRLVSYLRKSFYFSSSVPFPVLLTAAGKQGTGGREPGGIWEQLRLSLQHEVKHGSGKAMENVSHRKFPTMEMRKI